jgi:hypothetical protein
MNTESLLLFYCLLRCVLAFSYTTSLQLEYLFDSQIPLIWAEWLPARESEYAAACSKARRDGDPLPHRRMQPDDDANFMNLAAALKILLGRVVVVEELNRAQNLLHLFLQGFLHVRTSCIGRSPALANLYLGLYSSTWTTSSPIFTGLSTSSTRLETTVLCTDSGLSRTRG